MAGVNQCRKALIGYERVIRASLTLILELTFRYAHVHVDVITVMDSNLLKVFFKFLFSFSVYSLNTWILWPSIRGYIRIIQDLTFYAFNSMRNQYLNWTLGVSFWLSPSESSLAFDSCTHSPVSMLLHAPVNSY